MRNYMSAAIAALLVGGAFQAGYASPDLGATMTLTTSNAVVAAVAQQDEAEERRRARLSLGTRTGRTLTDVINQMNSEPPQYQEALGALNTLLGRSDLSDYDRSTALEIRGSVYGALENYNASLRDFEEVLRIDELPFDRLKQIRFNVAQLHFVNENYRQAINFMQQYFDEGGDQTESNSWYIIAAAYVSLDDFRNARRPAEQALRFDDQKQKKNYDLLNLVYSELNLQSERGELLEQMVERFPNEKSYWSQLAGAYHQADRTQDALASLEAAYNVGLLTEEDKIRNLAQYYAEQDNPYRGGKLLEQEMAAGSVERDVDNLKLLAQMWSQAREKQKAIDVLAEAARKSDTGELYYQLGQNYVALGQTEASEEFFQQGIDNLRQALNKGGLTSRDQGNAYLLIGNSLWNIGSTTPAGRDRARQAYRSATNYSSSRNSAQGWLDYIDGYERTLRAQDEQARRQAEEARQREIRRCETIIEVVELGGVQDAATVSDCRALLAEAEAGEDAASEGTDEAAATDENEEAAPEGESAGN